MENSKTVDKVKNSDKEKKWQCEIRWRINPKKENKIK